MMKNVWLKGVHQFSLCGCCVGETYFEHTPVLIPALHYPSPLIYPLRSFASNKLLQVGIQNCRFRSGRLVLRFTKKFMHWEFNGFRSHEIRSQSDSGLRALLR